MVYLQMQAELAENAATVANPQHRIAQSTFPGQLWLTATSSRSRVVCLQLTGGANNDSFSREAILSTPTYNFYRTSFSVSPEV